MKLKFRDFMVFRAFKTTLNLYWFYRSLHQIKVQIFFLSRFIVVIQQLHNCIMKWHFLCFFLPISICDHCFKRHLNLQNISLRMNNIESIYVFKYLYWRASCMEDRIDAWRHTKFRWSVFYSTEYCYTNTKKKRCNFLNC